MNRKLLLAGLVAGLLIGTATGQAPAPTPAPQPVPTPAPAPTAVTITGATSIPCYGFARLALAGSYTSAGWMCFPDRTTGASLVSSYTTPNGHVFVFSGPPGSYDVGAFALTPTGIQTIQVVVTIQPPTGPTPAPPGPPPQPPGPIPGPPTPGPPKPFPSTQHRPFPSTWLPARVVANA
jgi:chitinase